MSAISNSTRSFVITFKQPSRSLVLPFSKFTTLKYQQELYPNKTWDAWDIQIQKDKRGSPRSFIKMSKKYWIYDLIPIKMNCFVIIILFSLPLLYSYAGNN